MFVLDLMRLLGLPVIWGGLSVVYSSECLPFHGEAQFVVRSLDLCAPSCMCRLKKLNWNKASRSLHQAEAECRCMTYRWEVHEPYQRHLDSVLCCLCSIPHHSAIHTQ